MTTYFIRFWARFWARFHPQNVKIEALPAKTERAFSYTVKLFFSEIVSAAASAALFLFAHSYTSSLRCQHRDASLAGNLHVMDASHGLYKVAHLDVVHSAFKDTLDWLFFSVHDNITLLDHF